MVKGLGNDWTGRIEAIGPQLAARADDADREGRFVADNYALLAEHGFIAAAVPRELGGGGATHGEVCEMLRAIAHFCGSTALALSMHQHLVAATVWKYLRGQPGEGLLRRVATENLLLVSTGAGDWLSSNGSLTAVPGGYLYNGLKRFASGSPLGDVLVTSGVFQDPEQGPQVFHFPVPLSAPGVALQRDWDALGMRGTGSNSVELRDVFIPEESVAVKRPQGQWHPVWNVVLLVAAPIYCAPYLGVAESAAEIAKANLRTRDLEGQLSSEEFRCVPYVLGEMENALLTARMALRTCIENAKDYDFTPDTARANVTLQAKTILVRAVQDTVDKAMEAVGGRAYFRSLGLERRWRDIQAAEYHPLPEKRQQYITGRLALGLPPI